MGHEKEHPCVRQELCPWETDNFVPALGVRLQPGAKAHEGWQAALKRHTPVIHWLEK